MDPLEVRLFGGVQLRRRELSVPPIPSRAARSLFAYLVVHRELRHPRDRLAHEFWPDLDGARARRRLSHALWQIQDALGELGGDVGYLDVQTDTLAVAADAELWVDVEAFERGLDDARGRRDTQPGAGRLRDLTELERTVELYRGEFLAGHHDAWVDVEQERLHHRYQEALGWLVELAKRQGAYEDALVYARRLTNEDPLREDGHREVMRLSVLLGRSSDALRQYERCREVLAVELGTEPAVTTRRLYERILRTHQAGASRRGPSAPALPARLPLIGREAERDAAVGVLERALGGRGGAVFVEGETGAGTSRLIGEVTDDALWRGFTTLSVAANGPAPAAPYATVAELLAVALTPVRIERLRHRVPAAWFDELAELLPALGQQQRGGSPTGVREARDTEALRDALVGTLAALASLDPTLLVVDDLQWADPGSLEAFEQLAGQLGDRPLVLVLGYRGGEARSRPDVWAAVRGIDRAARPERLVLPPLDTFATAQLVRTLARGVSIGPAAVARLHRETGGNPLFLVETLRALAEADDLAALDAEDAVELPLPGSVRELVLSRADRLTADERQVLDLVAVAGLSLRPGELADACELPPEVVADALDQLVRRSLVVEVGDPDTVRLHHDQIRRALVEALAPPARQHLHRRVADALEVHRPDASEQLAHHLLEAGDHRRAIPHLVSAGRNAARVHAYAVADAHLRQAGELQARRPTRIGARVERLLLHESVLDVLGQHDAQRAALDELARLTAGDPAEVEVLRRRALLEGATGELAHAAELARAAVERSTEAADRTAHARALVTLGTISAWAGRRTEALEHLRRAADTPTGAETELEARTLLASVLRELRRYDDAGKELERVRALADEQGDPREEARALIVLGAIRTETGAVDQAVDLYGRAIELSDRIGFRRGACVARVNRANARYLSGHVGDALADYDGAARGFASLADPRGEAAVRLNSAHVRHTVLGDDDRARADAERALGDFETLGDHAFRATALDLLCRIALRHGDLDAAARALDGAERALQADPEGTAHEAAHLGLRRAELQLAHGRHAPAHDAVTTALRTIAIHDVADLRAEALALQSAIELARGELDEALRSSAAAVAALGPDAEAATLVHHTRARVLTGAGRRRDAERSAREALAILEARVGSLPADSRERAWRVPLHRAVRDSAANSPLGEVRREVARAEAPVGRPLTPEERIEVALDLPALRERAGDPESDPIAARRRLLVEVIEAIHAQGGSPTIEDLSACLDTSPATVRRDLAALRRSGHALSTRGSRAAG